ncbi:MAG: hypothetical protein KC464_29030 [Myxococcales bacterium]|nr:hypothetical protein [Myxococcales bacterium]
MPRLITIATLVLASSSLAAGVAAAGPIPTSVDDHRATVGFDVGVAASSGDTPSLAVAAQAGARLSPRVAVVARLSLVQLGDTILSFLGPTLQSWVTDRVLVAGGLGLTIDGPYDTVDGSSTLSIGDGPAVSARAGVAVLARPSGALMVSIEGLALLAGDGETLVAAAQLGWQY